MYCKKCGNEIQENWVTCPNCGAQLGQKVIENNDNLTTSNANENNTVDLKHLKPKKPLWKRWWFYLIVVIVIIMGITMCSGGNSESSTGTVSDNNQEAISLEEAGGYNAWVESGYKNKVRTDIVVDLPVVERDENNYAVHISTSLGDTIFVKQKDDSPASEWQWLKEASPNEENETAAVFKATLTLSNYYELDGKTYPVFIIEEVTSYNVAINEIENAGETITLPVNVVNNTGIDIYYLFASLVGVDNWEEDILDEDVLPAGENFVINFTYAKNETDWDFAMGDVNGTLIEFYGLDFESCNPEGATLTLTYDGTTGTATLE